MATPTLRLRRDQPRVTRFTKGRLIVMAVLLFAGALFFAATGAVSLETQLGFRNRAARADGTVLGLPAHPLVRFAVPDGPVIDFRPSGLILTPHPGDKVVVLYYPGNPGESARVDSLPAMAGGGAFMILMALVAAAMGSLAVIQLRTLRQNAAA